MKKDNITRVETTKSIIEELFVEKLSATNFSWSQPGYVFRGVADECAFVGEILSPTVIKYKADVISEGAPEDYYTLEEFLKLYTPDDEFIKIKDVLHWIQTNEEELKEQYNDECITKPVRDGGLAALDTLACCLNLR